MRILLLTLLLVTPAAAEEPATPPSAETAAPAEAEPPGEVVPDRALATDPGTLECAELVPPEVLYRAAPRPPRGLRGKGRREEVVLAARIGEDGKLGELRAVETTRDDLVRPALEAARRWRFAPARCDGEPVAMGYKLVLRFR